MERHMPKRLKIGDIIDGKYTIVEAFEPGGMGLVFKVRSTEGKVRALKVCRETEDDDVRRFKREVRIMKKIKHPNVITVVDDNLDHDPPYFVMCLARASLASESAEYVDDEQRVLDALEQICKGLQAIHNSDVVHRDIKPANALVLKDGTIVVADLGLSKLNDRDSTILTMSRAIVGTEAYLAPEQRMPKGSREADQRTDIYQVGKTLYELLTGRNPAFIDVSDVPPGLARIIKRSTREDPSERYQTVGELMDARYPRHPCNP